MHLEAGTFRYTLPQIMSSGSSFFKLQKIKKATVFFETQCISRRGNYIIIYIIIIIIIIMLE